MRAVTAGTECAVLMAAVVEASHRWAAGAGRGRAHGHQAAGGLGGEAIIVLGYSSRRPAATRALQRWRCQIAVRSQDPERSSRFIVTGAGGDGRESEAAAMAAYARDVLSVPADRIVLEEKASSTWENIELSLPLADRCAVIKIASDPLHARRATRYVAAIRPDLASRLVPAAVYRPLEHPVLKAGTLVYEVYLTVRRRLRPAGGGSATAPVTAPAAADEARA